MAAPRRLPATTRGFTLIELLAVVVIVAVLATLATFGLRKYVFASKTAEAFYMIGAIKSAQEAYRDETFTYLAITPAGDFLNATGAYPQGEMPGRKKWSWDNSNGPDHAAWQRLGVRTNHPVLYGYTCLVGDANTAPPQPFLNRTVTWPTPTGPWYVVRAIADKDGDGQPSIFVGSSFTTEIWSENEDG